MSMSVNVASLSAQERAALISQIAAVETREAQRNADANSATEAVRKLLDSAAKELSAISARFAVPTQVQLPLTNGTHKAPVKRAKRKVAAKAKPLPAKFKNTNGPQTWSGRGPTPRWMPKDKTAWQPYTISA